MAPNRAASLDSVLRVAPSQKFAIDPRGRRVRFMSHTFTYPPQTVRTFTLHLVIEEDANESAMTAFKLALKLAYLYHVM